MSSVGARARLSFCIHMVLCNRKIEHNERKMLQFALHELPPSFLATPEECVRFAGVPINHCREASPGHHSRWQNVPTEPRSCANQYSIASGHDCQAIHFPSDGLVV